MQAIVCASRNWGIGRDGQLLYRLKGDLTRFRELTTGNTVIFGSRTLHTFPGGKPLSGRRNIILTHSNAPIEGAELAHSVRDVVALAGDGDDVFVIGGASVYTMMLPYCDRVLVTRVDAEEDADSFFPNLDNHNDWTLEREEPEIEEGGLRFRYMYYTRTGKKAAAPH